MEKHLDGYMINFFHHFWDMIKMEVWRFVEDSRQDRGVLQTFNATFLTLIPKSEVADSPSQFRPIALCNVIYKIIPKVIAIRLKLILPTMVAPE